MFRMRLRSAALFSVFLFLVTTTPAQRRPRPASIALQVHGQVRYAAGNRPAEFVLVRLESFAGGIAGEVTTDRSGKFMFSGLGPELYAVSVRVPGYQEVKQQVDLRVQMSDYIQLQLIADSSRAQPSPAKISAVVDANVPRTALSEFEKGRDALTQAKNIDQGILHLENAVRIYPQYVEAMLLLGTAYMDQSDWEKAESRLREVLTMAPDTTSAHLALGELYFRTMKYPEADKEMLAGIKLIRTVQGHFSAGPVVLRADDLS